MLLNKGQTDILTALSQHITQMAAGTGSAAEAATDSALTNQANTPVTSFDLSTQGQIVFYAVLPASVAAMTITEMGLLTADGKLLFRKVVSATPKIAGQSVSLQYQIKIQ